LFDVSVPTINEHLKNVFSEGELDDPSVIRNSRITASDGKSYHTNYYNPNVIISMGYRIIGQKNVLKYILQSIRTNIRLIRRKFTPFALQKRIFGAYKVQHNRRRARMLGAEKCCRKFLQKSAVF